MGVNKEETSDTTMNNTQCQTGQNEGQSQSALTAEELNNGDKYKFAANYNQEKVINCCIESPEYAAVNRAKFNLKIENGVQNFMVTPLDDEWFSPGYDEVGGHEMARKTVAEEQKNPSPAVFTEPQKRSPSPVYAEVHKDKKKNKQHEDKPVVVEERERSQSPEYSKVEKVNKHSMDIVNQENQEDEQHYYHSLESPAEHGCNEDNNGETVHASEHSQESQVVSTQSMLYETPDPDATNTPTEITESDPEVNTFPNPSYRIYKIIHAAD